MTNTSRSFSRWAILTGEYPPSPGGVSDYTHLLARAMIDRGAEVHVFAPPVQGRQNAASGVIVHELPDHYGLSSLSFLSRELDRINPEQLLLQYVPHAFAWRAMNVPLCNWLRRAAKRRPLTTMFHEVAYPLESNQPLKHRLIAYINRWMARTIGHASQRIFVSIPAWKELLESFGVAPEKISISPIFSNLPTSVDRQAASELHLKYAFENEMLVGH